MSLGHRKWNFFGYGVEPLLDESEYDLAEEEWELIEQVRARGVLDADTEGSVLATGDGRRYWGYYGGYSSSYAHKFTYEEWVAQQDAKPLSPKAQARAELIKHFTELKEQKDQAKKEREEYERSIAQSRQGQESWAAWNASDTKKIREEHAKELTAYQLESARALQRKSDEEHERRRLISIEVSEIERSIFECTENIDCSVLDRAMMRTMLRYQNFGPGKGKTWDAREFALYISATRRDDLLTMTLRDVERCYDTLKALVVNV